MTNYQDPFGDYHLPLSDAVFFQFRELIYGHSGIFLNDQKKEFVKGRLNKRLNKMAFKSFESYVKFLRDNPDGEEWQTFTNLISTNVSYFFREKEHFDYMNREVLPKLRNNPEVNIWSAGCSNGSEPYSLSIYYHEYLQKSPLARQQKLQIIASDISTKILAEAMRGVYDENSLKEIPVDMRYRYFQKGINKQKGKYRIRDFVREPVTFTHFNLMHFPYNFPLKFDMIFCRNVMIYFDDETRRTVVENYKKVLKPGGLLFVSFSESVNASIMKSVASAVYVNE